MNVPHLSIVVPTHNRASALVRLLEALGRQDVDPATFEAIVVADGCRDDTVARARATSWPFHVNAIAQAAAGPAEARNRGARAARAPVLLFLDDDVEPLPGLVRAHLSFHARHGDAIAIGDLPPVVAARGLFGIILRGWWQSMHESSRLPGHRHTFRDLLSGHFSIPRATFERLGGFDSTLTCHEDYEFGCRAIEQGVTMRFEPSATAIHHDSTVMDKTLARKLVEGRVDVELSRRYPGLAPLLPLARLRDLGRLHRLLLGLGARVPAIGDAAAGGLARTLLPAYESARLRYRWRALLEVLLDYWYWRGVRMAATEAQRQALLNMPVAAPEPELTIDLAGGLDGAERLLDAARPRRARLMFAGETIRTIPQRPGVEPLRGAHLRRIIARECANEFVRAAARAGCAPACLPLDPAFTRDAPSTRSGEDAVAGEWVA